MGSSSLLVLIGSHSICNSFVVNQFLYFTPNGENSLCYTPKKQWEQFGGEKKLYYFLLAKYTPMSRKNGGQKWECRYHTLLLVLEATSYQTKIFRNIQFVCKVATRKSTRKLISGLLSMSVSNNDGWKWALRMFHDLSRHETRVHFQLAQDQQCEPEKTLLL